MQKLLTMTALVAFLGVSSFPALANEATGSITDIDVPFGTITLDNGQTYRVAPVRQFGPDVSNSTPAVLASFKAGDRVVIRFVIFGGELVASSVAPAKR